jgi:M6 family metalloprotease-like protein
MNEPGYNGTGSFKDYYLEVSRDLLTINSTITPWVKVQENHDYYGPDKKWGEFALQSVQAAADAGIDFSNFDNDGDGIVEGISIIHQGAGQEVTGDETDIWSHSYSFSAWGVPESERTFNGVVVDQYTLQPEWRSNASDMSTIGVICHEFGHNLGIPDFYDVNEEYYDGTSVWDIMASGTYNGSPTGSSPAHHNPFSKNELNWVDVTVINDVGPIELSPVISSGQVIRVNSPVENEYLLLENRQETGFDTYLPHGGMLVYHADGNLIEERRQTNTINVDEHQGFYPIAAGGFINNASCPFPGPENKTELTDHSDPATQTWDGQPFNRSITSIAMTGDVITFDFMYIQDGSPITFDASVMDEQSIDLSWTPSSQNHPVLLAWSPDGTFGNPVNGQTYNAGDQITGGGTVLYYGNLHSSFLHNALEPSTDYYYSIWSYKGDLYSQNLIENNRTYANPVSIFPWSDGFENGLVNWAEEYVTGQIAWTQQETGFYEYPPEAFEGTSFAFLLAPDLDETLTRLISPTLELQSNTTYYLNFRHIQAEWEGYQDDLRILVKPESTNKWEEIAYFGSHVPEWAERRLIIPFSESIQIAFEGTTRYGYGIGIDDVQVYEATTCSSPPDISSSNFAVDNVTETSMNLSWNRGNGDAVLVVAREDTAIYELPDNGTKYTANSEFGLGDKIADRTYVIYNGPATQFSLNGLNHTTDYHFAFFEYYSDNFCYENSPQTATFPSAPRFYDISVNITDTKGNAIENAMVCIGNDTLFTNQLGNISLRLKHDDIFYRIDASKAGFTPKTHRFVPNEPQTVSMNLREFQALAPYNLQASNNYKTVELSWQPVIHDNFDNYQAFETEIEGWTFIDNDKRLTYGIKSLSWPNEHHPMAFMAFGVYEPETLPIEYNISSWSGDKVLAAFAAEGAQSDDWVISPEFRVRENDFFSFMARTLDAAWGKEVINIKIKAANDTEWTTLHQGSEVPENWTRYEYDLSQYAGLKVKVAVQSIGYETFALLLDDFIVGTELGPLNNEPLQPSPTKSIKRAKSNLILHTRKPQRNPQMTEPEKVSPLYFGNVEYRIYRDEQEIASVLGFANNTYDNELLNCSQYDYTVRALFPDINVESEPSNIITTETCFSVIFIIKDKEGKPITTANINFNNETLTTDANGEALFTGIDSENEKTYTISAPEYDNKENSVNITEDTVIESVLNNSSSSIYETWTNEIHFAPNPVAHTGYLNGLPHGLYKVELFDVSGKQMDEAVIYGGKQIEWDFSSYKSGIYIMFVKTIDGETLSLKIIKINTATD